jgi:hypothetical protein
MYMTIIDYAKGCVLLMSLPIKVSRRRQLSLSCASTGGDEHLSSVIQKIIAAGANVIPMTSNRISA